MFFTQEKQTSIAKALYEAEKTVKPIPTLTPQYPAMTEEDAYHIQQEGLKLRLAEGSRVVGRKIGITSRGMMEKLHCDSPDFGYLLDTMLVPEGTACSRKEMNIPIVEGEIAFIMGEDLTGPAVTTADIMNATAWVIPCFEICDGRYPNWVVTVRDTISDNAGACKFVLGGSPKRIQDVNLRYIGMVMEKNGQFTGSAAGAEVMGTPLNSMVWLVNKLAQFGDGLHKGDIVLSGAFMAAIPAIAGDNFCLGVDGFPPLTVSFK